MIIRIGPFSKKRNEKTDLIFNSKTCFFQYAIVQQK